MENAIAGESIDANEQSMNIPTRSLMKENNEIEEKYGGNNLKRNVASFTTAGSKKMIKVTAEDILNATQILGNDDDQVCYTIDLF